MLTLNKKDSSLLRAALSSEANLFYWLKNETVLIGNNEYATIVAQFETWEEASEGDGLTLTNADNTTEPLSGIDQFPIPPQR